MIKEKRQVKQVILVRNDLINHKTGLPVSTGKLISQGAHASLKAVLNIMYTDQEWSDDNVCVTFRELDTRADNAVGIWLDGTYTKITLAVSSSEELQDFYNKAKQLNLPCSLIKDNGLTDFNGEKPFTAVAIGPHWSDVIDTITGHLALFA